jgi:hypothetical protein
MKKNMSQYESNKNRSKANKLKDLRIKSKEFNRSGEEENENRNEDKFDVSLIYHMVVCGLSRDCNHWKLIFQKLVQFML